MRLSAAAAFAAGDLRRAADICEGMGAVTEEARDRLWLAEDQVKRFLVADEVGLGKTMVAKGVIARTVEHLRDTGKRIDIVYICSNSQIARQTGLSREQLYRSFSETGNPTLKTTIAVMKALGIELTAKVHG